jgi:hypothetical protein
MDHRYPGRITFFDVGKDERVVLRSRLEARWATFFTAAELAWEYEPQTFQLPNDQWYTPDFYLPEVGWIEIKATEDDARASEAKLRLFASNRRDLIHQSRRNDFYTICGTRPGFDIHRFHRWDPEPMEIHWARDIYLLFCGVKARNTAETCKMHPIDWVKWCLSRARLPIEPSRHLDEYVFAYRHHELGTSFRALSESARHGGVMSLTAREIEQLRKRFT